MWIQSFPSPRLVALTKAEEPCLPYYLPIPGGRFIPFPRVSNRIWTRVAVSISHDDNHYTTSTFISPEVWKTSKFDDLQLWYCNAVYNQNTIERWIKGCILPFPKKGDLGIAKNYRVITLISTMAKIYNVLHVKHIEPGIENILLKN